MSALSPGAISGEIKTSLPTIECHPLVLFSILDSYNRRPTGTKSVIGTLLGVTSTRTVDLNGSLSTSEVVTVTNAFTVPHEVFSNDSLAIGKDFNRQMLELHLRVNPKESIVGWFSTTTEDGKFVVETTSAIHQFYSEETAKGSNTLQLQNNQAVHMVVDTSMTDDRINFKGFVSDSLVVCGATLATSYHEVPTKVVATDCERVAVSSMIQDATNPNRKNSSNNSSNNNNNSNTDSLLEMVSTLKAHIDAVNAGTKQKDEKLGQEIVDALAAIPKIRPEVFSKMFRGNMQDLLMVKYLAEVTKTQLAISEKLNQTLQV